MILGPLIEDYPTPISGPAHLLGENSNEYDLEFLKGDALLKRINDAVEEVGLYEATTINATTYLMNSLVHHSDP